MVPGGLGEGTLTRIFVKKGARGNNITLCTSFFKIDSTLRESVRHLVNIEEK